MLAGLHNHSPLLTMPQDCVFHVTGHKFWRVVNEAHLSRSWVIENIKFYSDKHAKVPLETKPAKAFASSSYLGYEPGSAFDNKSSTYWLPNGWYDRGAGEDFIGYEFDQPVAINSVRIIHQKGQGNVVSTKMYVEASDAYGGPYTTKWIIENPQGTSNKRFNNKSKWLSYSLYIMHVYFILIMVTVMVKVQFGLSSYE